MPPQVLRFATYLAPSMLPVYQFVAAAIGERLGCRTELRTGTSFAAFGAGQVDVGFLCGLPYVHLADQRPAPVELLAAPVLDGTRYGANPIYFSDVIVRRAGPFQSFADLRGCVWAYNDRDSHSGYNVVRYHLVQLGETRGYFGRVVEAGWHQQAIRLVAGGVVDAAAIDSQVLAIAARDQPDLVRHVKVITTLGPSTIQPVVAARQVADTLKADIQAVLVSLAGDRAAWAPLAHGFVQRFTRITDAAYDDIRCMQAAAQAADFMTLR